MKGATRFGQSFNQETEKKFLTRFHAPDYEVPPSSQVQTAECCCPNYAIVQSYVIPTINPVDSLVVYATPMWSQTIISHLHNMLTLDSFRGYV